MKTQEMSEIGEIYTADKKIYTAAGTDGIDKFHLCFIPFYIYYIYSKHVFIYLSMSLMIKYTCLRDIAFVLMTGTDQVGHELEVRTLF